MTNCSTCHRDYDEANTKAVDHHTKPIACNARRTCRCQGRPGCYACGDSFCYCTAH
ncbi:hypothetical protein [Streptomyces sp. NPDC048611]|uniref:hypothetical protein n=1 Tax=Streptomyces sp. NPDC048611 TaxID=3155635 RepID=UPI003438D2F0